MSKQRFLSYFLILTFCGFTGCVSVSLSGAKGAATAQGVSYSQPSKPFEEVKVKSADHAWQNRENGNTISYLSSCNDPSDPTLEGARADFLSGLSGLKVLNENQTSFNGREALTTAAEGSLDGVKTRLELMLFKKNNCLYTISYVAVANSFDQNREVYNHFVQSFRAP